MREQEIKDAFHESKETEKIIKRPGINPVGCYSQVVLLWFFVLYSFAWNRTTTSEVRFSFHAKPLRSKGAKYFFGSCIVFFASLRGTVPRLLRFDSLFTPSRQGAKAQSISAGALSST